MLVFSRRAISLATVMAAVVFSARTPSAIASAVGEAADASLRMLRRAVLPQRDGSHLPLLFALRQLHDPDLRPLFIHLANSDDWQIQVHGVLGLAEIDPAKHVDPNLIVHIALPAQESVIATALDLQLLPADQIGELLKAEHMNPMARLILLAEQVSLKQQVDINELRDLAIADDDHIAGLSSGLLAQLGQPEALAAFTSRLGQKSSSQPESRVSPQLLMWLFEAVRRYRLDACLPWVKALVKSPQADDDVAYRGAFTVLQLDPTAGIGLWSSLLGDQPTHQRRVRFTLMLLAAGHTIPPSAYDRISADPSNADDELIIRMKAVGTAISAGADPSDAMIQLLDLNHLKSSDWVMTSLEKLPPDQASRVYEHLINRLARTKVDEGDAVALAVQATSKLFAIDPKGVLERLRVADDDSILQQALLLGLFEADSPQVGETAATLRRIGSGKADSLALLLIAKHIKTLSEDDQNQLGKIAAGGGRVSGILQVQAAWLYLKRTGQSQAALAAIQE